MDREYLEYLENIREYREYLGYIENSKKLDSPPTPQNNNKVTTVMNRIFFRRRNTNGVQKHFSDYCRNRIMITMKFPLTAERMVIINR